jgi:hypothetical protein
VITEKIMEEKSDKTKKIYGKIKKKYTQKSVKKRIEALFLDNIGKVITREQIIKAATDLKTQKQPENWHQRLSELRTDDGYTILSWRNRGWLRVEEYLMPSSEKRSIAGKRVRPDKDTWQCVLQRANYSCEWAEGNEICGLKEGAVDPVGGGRVKLTPDHKNPHSINPDADTKDAQQWQALCGRHQVIKKNYWDTNTGKMNVYAIIQSSTSSEKEIIFKFLLDYFGYVQDKAGNIHKLEIGKQ